MVEVFKTDVSHADHAAALVQEIERSFVGYEVNFDLEDCDKILRVKSQDSVQSQDLIDLLKSFGFTAEILPDISHPALRLSRMFYHLNR
jgi:hypothetical protein